MLNFILATLFWTISLYGLLEIIKKMIYSFTYSKIGDNNTYVILAVKNGENYIEGTLKAMVSKMLTESITPLKKIIVVDLNSSDMTYEIIKRIGKDNDNIKIVNWEKCKDILDKINSNY